MTRLRVAHVGTYHRDSADGTEKTVAGLVTWLPQQDVEVEVWQPRRGLTALRGQHVDGVQMWDLPAYPAPRGYWRGLPAVTRPFVAERQHAFDIIHLHSGFVPEHVAIAALLRVPYVIAPNGIYSPANLRGRSRWFKQGWWQLRERAYARGAALLHSVSEREYDELHALLPQMPLTLVPNALDLDGIPATVAVPSSDRRVLLYLGRLAVEQKGLDVLLIGYRQFLNETRDQTTRLLLVGPDYRGGRAELGGLIASLDLGERVELREPVFGEAKWQLLANAWAFVHPSRWDGLPFAVLEALAARRPVLISPATNLADLVERYDTGVVAGANAADIARGVRALVHLPIDQHQLIGSNGYRLVQDRFTWPRAAQTMAEAYATVARRDSARRKERDATEPSLAEV